MRKRPSCFLILCLAVLVCLFITFQGCQQGDSGISPVHIFQRLKRKLPEFDDSPLAALRHQGKLVLPSKDKFSNMTTPALLDTLHSYLGNTDIMCHRILRMGSIRDGGWDICDDVDYRPIRPCLVYSFGIADDFSFDDYIANTYGCEVYAFDPSTEKENHQRSKLVMFFKLGLAEVDTRIERDTWEVHTVSTLKKMFAHSQMPLDVLKMDVEGTEWNALPQIIKSGEARRVRQLLVEYHTWTHERDNVLSYLNTLKDLYDAGFRKFYVHKNPACFFDNSDRFPLQRTDCYEVHYVNLNFHP